MKRNYSRLARVEESKNMRMATTFGLLTIGVIVLLVIFGIPAITNVAGYIFDLKGKTPIINADKTPPGPPFIKPFSEASNKERLTIEGTAEAEATVMVYVNDEKTETEADSSGNFTVDVVLAKGTNAIHAKVKDAAGNESVDSNTFNVFYSKDKPKLEVAKPSQGDNYFGDKQRQISVDGSTCNDCSVTVNDRIALVDSTGNFKLNYSLNDGNNDLNIRTVDKAGNSEETTISVTFTP